MFSSLVCQSDRFFCGIFPMDGFHRSQCSRTSTYRFVDHLGMVNYSEISPADLGVSHGLPLRQLSFPMSSITLHWFKCQQRFVCYLDYKRRRFPSIFCSKLCIEKPESL
ncbi:hypothetical protein AHF37_01669 [Paragonimus kellicotti]|nr:hypothetical protein AHF37_01669 [Paragonimus kellicotti]